MALSDFLNREAVSSPSDWKGVPFKVESTETAQNALEEADNGIAIAQRNSENRMKADRIRKQIENLKAQNEALRQQKESIKAHSLSELDEDEVVRLAKSKGIRDEDVTQWLNARIARTNREVSQGQKTEMGKVAEAEAAKAKEIEKTNKDAASQSIYEAIKELDKVKVEDLPESVKASSVNAAYNQVVSRMNAFKRNYGESWNDYAQNEYVPTKDILVIPGSPASATPASGQKRIVVDGVQLDEKETTAYESKGIGDEERRNIVSAAARRQREDNERKEKERIARQTELADIARDLGTINAEAEDKVVVAVNKALRSTDQAVSSAAGRIKKFVAEDKEYTTWESLKKLMR